MTGDVNVDSQVWQQQAEAAQHGSRDSCQQVALGTVPVPSFVFVWIHRHDLKYVTMNKAGVNKVSVASSTPPLPDSNDLEQGSDLVLSRVSGSS